MATAPPGSGWTELTDGTKKRMSGLPPGLGPSHAGWGSPRAGVGLGLGAAVCVLQGWWPNKDRRAQRRETVALRREALHVCPTQGTTPKEGGDAGGSPWSPWPWPGGRFSHVPLACPPEPWFTPLAREGGVGSGLGCGGTGRLRPPRRPLLGLDGVHVHQPESPARSAGQ